MPKLNIVINEDIERVLSKHANKRKISLNDMVNIVLESWLDDKDNELYEKSSSKVKT